MVFLVVKESFWNRDSSGSRIQGEKRKEEMREGEQREGHLTEVAMVK